MSFNYADVPAQIKKTLNDDETIKIIDDKKYLCWHDLIDIVVPLFYDPSILLCPRVPLPLWGVNPRSILTQIDDNWWERTRQRVYMSQGNTCACCGTHKTQQKGFRKYLDAHEYYDIDWTTGKTTLRMIVPLCSYCHNFIHFGRLTAKYESGELYEKEYYAIISHGNTLLSKAGLPLKNLDANVNDNINNLEWQSFYLSLIINDEEQKFYSLYKNEEDLLAHY